MKKSRSLKICRRTSEKEMPSYIAPTVTPADVPRRTSNRESRGRLAAGKRSAISWHSFDYTTTSI